VTKKNVELFEDLLECLAKNGRGIYTHCCLSTNGG